METVRIVIQGKVQGVFFRKYAFEEAIKLGVNGFVLNAPGGNVVIEVTGDKELINEMVQWCHRGSPLSKVEKVEITEIPYKEYSGFTIRY